MHADRSTGGSAWSKHRVTGQYRVTSCARIQQACYSAIREHHARNGGPYSLPVRARASVIHINRTEKGVKGKKSRHSWHIHRDGPSSTRAAPRSAVPAQSPTSCPLACRRNPNAVPFPPFPRESWPPREMSPSHAATARSAGRASVAQLLSQTCTLT